MISLKIGGIIVAAFITGSFIASPELRAFAANTVGSSDIINESILSEDIKNSQVKASDIATDAVGAAELQGVTKLIFAQCKADNTEATTPIDAGKHLGVDCSISGVDSDDSAIVSMNSGVVCFDITKSEVSSFGVLVILENECGSTVSLSAAQFGVIVYDK